jgi:hypothetical protein
VLHYYILWVGLLGRARAASCTTWPRPLSQASQLKAFLQPASTCTLRLPNDRSCSRVLLPVCQVNMIRSTELSGQGKRRGHMPSKSQRGFGFFVGPNARNCCCVPFEPHVYRVISRTAQARAQSNNASGQLQDCFMFQLSKALSHATSLQCSSGTAVAL